MIPRTSPLLAALAAALLAACDRAPAPRPDPLPADTTGSRSAQVAAPADAPPGGSAQAPAPANAPVSGGDQATASASATVSGGTQATLPGEVHVVPPSPSPGNGERAGGEGQGPRPATTPPAPLVEVLEAQALVPGAATPLRSGEQVTVDPGATFRITLKGTYPGARLALLDGADAMVAGAGAREAGTTTTVTFQPAAPLKPGSSYRLRIDGATTRELQAADGTARGPVEFAVLAAGEPPPEPRSRTLAKSTRAKKRP